MATPGVPPNAPGMPVAPPDSTFIATLKYVYFMRFSIMLWLFFPLLVALDWSGALAAMTRGIVALGSGWHLFFASFFVVAAGWVALLSARIACAYGTDRFGCAPPLFFSIGQKMSWWAFLGAQVPGFFLLGYVGHATFVEQGDPPALGLTAIVLTMIAGVLVALLCWTFMAGIYYWMFWRPNSAAANTAKAFVVPYSGLFQQIEATAPSRPILALLHLFERAAWFGPGFRDVKRGDLKLHSGHAFAFLTLGLLAGIYLAFWDFTAPIELAKVRLIECVIFLVAALIWAFLTWKTPPQGPPQKWKNALRMFVLFFPMILVVSLPFWSENRPLAMPVLGFVTVLVTFVLWGLGGLAFILDRFRVPVLTSVAAFFILFNLLVGKFSGSDDHFLASFDVPAKDAQGKSVQPAGLTPYEVLNRFEGEKNGRPVIIVTATGGGIHAAAWTSSVLNNIENSFKPSNAQSETTFHGSILMMSTVSGGSVGVAPWLSHYLSDNNFKGNDTAIAGCTDLQAVAWGLAYADFLRMLFPLRFSALGKTLNTYDRGWALEQAFGRNRLAKCNTEEIEKSTYDGEKEERISKFDIGQNPGLPAFSMNTTAEETGARFLIANYKVEPDPGKDGPNQSRAEVTPAHSFLPYLGRDVTLSTAARLSANFPYISPMPRLDDGGLTEAEKNRRNYHFGDGGYFDNDGTASAMEFLWYALRNRKTEESRIPVLILEIRDGPDPSGLGDPDPKKSDWPGQTVGPLATFYNANHVSVTRRNRRELCFLENALHEKASFTHIVIPYIPTPRECAEQEGCKADPQPLSWHLTAQQKLDIDHAVNAVPTQNQIKGISDWYFKSMPEPGAQNKKAEALEKGKAQRSEKPASEVEMPKADDDTHTCYVEVLEKAIAVKR